MRLRPWVGLLTTLLTAIPAMADGNYPPRTGGDYSGPRWYGYYANNKFVSANADHTNITMVAATIKGKDHRTQETTAITYIRAGALDAKHNGEKAMVDVESIVFTVGTIVSGGNAHQCYSEDTTALGDFETLVEDLETDGTLLANDPEHSTVIAFYVADEPSNNCLLDQLIDNYTYVPNGALVDAVTAIRQNPDTTNFPLATIVSEMDGQGGYFSSIQGMSLFDWIGLDDYDSDVDTYITHFKFMEQYLYFHPEGSGTPQHYFMVPTVTSGLGSGGVFTNVTPIQDAFNDTLDPFNSVIGIMPFEWSDSTNSNGMNATSSWAPEYIALGKSIVALDTSSAVTANVISSLLLH